MDDAEDSCRRADAEGERDNRDGRETRRARQRPKGVFQILNHGCPVRRSQAEYVALAPATHGCGPAPAFPVVFK